MSEKKETGLTINSFSAMDIVKSEELLSQILISNIAPPNSKKEDIIGAIVTGREFGVPPMKSVLLMDILTPSKATILYKGTSLGMDIVESVNTIYEIQGKVVVGGNAMMAILRKHGIDCIYEESCVKIYGKYGMSGAYKGEIIPDRDVEHLGDDLIYLTKNMTQSDVDEIKKTKPRCIFYTEIVVDWRTTIRFKREGFEDHVRSLTYSEAKEAGIIYEKDGKTIKKPWKNKAIMLQHKVVGAGGRFIAGDIVGLMYTSGEALEFADNDLSIVEQKLSEEANDNKDFAEATVVDE